MSSSTSSFRSESKVIVAVLLVLVVVELCFVRWTGALSFDLRHILAIPQTAASLAEGDAPRVLLLGNSITRHGIDLPRLEDELESLGTKPTVKAVQPDATNVNEWYFALKHYFLSEDIIPDFVIIPATEYHLVDEPILLSRNAAYYCGSEDFRHVLAHELTSVDRRVEFVAARYSKAFANRGRVQLRLFWKIIPLYQEFLEAQEAGMFDRQPPAVPTPAATASPRSFHRLTQLLGLAEEYGFQFIIYAAPARSPYEFPPEALVAIEETGTIFWDGRQLPGIADEILPDGSHLNPAGAVIFTDHLAGKLAPLLQPR